MELTFSGTLDEFNSLYRQSSAEGQASILTRLTSIDSRLETLMASTKDYTDQIKAKLDAATVAIAAESTVDDSIIALLNTVVQGNKDLQARIAELSVDPAVAQQISDLFDANNAAIEANRAKVAAAVTANTPAAPDASPV